ncbi:uncharacterized protein LOC112050008 [Bicyclus anynana]|uniref:Uncharacterized protein LOC112050008 n=1 Tax=Bicyclus anynana TaxID=110368 RepID=A0ABM3LJ51_BICAN|nr:uncharacterized protein LOC112050008 [Bicyclus anynana]
MSLIIETLILLALITHSMNIDVDYFIDQDDTSDTPHAVTNSSDARRTLENHHLTKANVSSSKSLFNDLKKADDEVEDEMILSYNVAPHLGLTVAAKEKIKLSVGGNHTNLLTTKCKQISTQSTLSLNLNSFDEYDYKYSNDTDEIGSLLLRQQIVEEKLASPPNKTETDTPFGKFYNLEPAVNQDINIIYNRQTFNNTWYVPQDFPCWELPILYGELGSKKKKENIFLIHGGNLVNVKETTIEKLTNYKPVEPPISRVVNKWCEVEPCYGDHTLCLFPKIVISNICDKEYKVHVPSILDQAAVVNTINTMRNHIANGVSKRYSHLPSAANMKQITYDYDLEEMAQAWLRQCLPGSAPCSALDENLVAHLECTKYAKYCCPKNSKSFFKW